MPMGFSPHLSGSYKEKTKRSKKRRGARFLIFMVASLLLRPRVYPYKGEEEYHQINKLKKSRRKTRGSILSRFDF